MGLFTSVLTHFTVVQPLSTFVQGSFTFVWTLFTLAPARGRRASGEFGGEARLAALLHRERRGGEQQRELVGRQ